MCLVIKKMAPQNCKLIPYYDTNTAEENCLLLVLLNTLQNDPVFKLEDF